MKAIMNTINGEFPREGFTAEPFDINLKIDGYWLNEILDELYPEKDFKSLVPTLQIMEEDKESEIVWRRILPKTGETSICPILMCPDDRDFLCTLIIAEIVNTGNSVKWNRIGINNKQEMNPENVGKSVEWFDGIKPLEFGIKEYITMLSKLKEQHDIALIRWEKENQELQNESEDSRSSK